MTALSPPPPPSDSPSTWSIIFCTEQERVICVRCKSKCVQGSCLGIAQTTNCFGMIFWSSPSCLPTFILELSALDRISALEVKSEKLDWLISEIQSLKLKIIAPKKSDYPYLRAALEIGLATLLAIVIQRNGKLKVMNICLLTKGPKTENQKSSRRT